MAKNKDWTGDRNSTFKTLGASNHTDKDRQAEDFYATDPWAIDVLLDAESFDRRDKIWEPACVDNETEYFNGTTGWCKISDYCGEDVLVYDIQTGLAKLEKPLAYIRQKYTGQFHYWQNLNVDMCLTDEHTVLYEPRRKSGVFCTMSAKSVAETYQKDSNGFRGRIPTTFDLTTMQQNISETLLRVAIMCQADGKQASKNSYIIRVKKIRKIERVQYLLDQAGIRYSTGKEGENTKFQFVSPLGTKEFPLRWIYLPRELKVAFIDEITKWDGSVHADGSEYYYTNSKHNADIVQMIANSIGITAKIIEDKREKRNINYRVALIRQTNKFALRKTTKDNYSLIEGDGYKYCFTTSTGYLVLRRNGKIFVTGNCGQGHLSKRLEKLGYTVFSSDLVDRGYGKGGVDFLKCIKPFNGHIITNPPYKFAQEFIEHAMNIVAQDCKVAMFLKVQFLEGKARKALFKKYPPRTVYVSSSRILCAKNGDFEGMKAGGGSAVAYAWYVFVKGHQGNTLLKWVN